jgi:ABC-type dipeptide/oligopeptide/nickel transport system ATPase subunit
MLVTVENVSKSYNKGNQILSGINLTINRGEVVGLVGESGSGKSTLARIIMQLEKADEGCITFKGVPITKHSRKEFYNACQLIFQNASAALNPTWSVLELLREPLLNMKSSRDVHIIEMLEKVKLTEAHLTRKPAELSGGERQRVNLLRSILVEPELVICDEIVSNLDRLTQREVVDMLSTMAREREMALLFISHDLKVVQSLCNRVYVMKDGEIVEESTKVDGEFHFTHPYAKRLFGKSRLTHTKDLG